MVKGEVDKMTKQMEELNVMQEHIAFDLKTLGIDVEDAKIAVKKHYLHNRHKQKQFNCRNKKQQ